MKYAVKFAKVGSKRIALSPEEADSEDAASLIEEWTVEARESTSGTAIRTDTLTPKVIAELTGETDPAKIDDAPASVRNLAYCFAFAEVNFLSVSGPETSLTEPTRETIQKVPETVLMALVNAADPRGRMLKSEADDLAKKLRPTPDASTKGVG